MRQGERCRLTILYRCSYTRLTTQRETVSEQARQTGGDDLFPRAFDVITDPALLD
jgi:hypothetical protein